MKEQSYELLELTNQDTKYYSDWENVPSQYVGVRLNIEGNMGQSVKLLYNEVDGLDLTYKNNRADVTMKFVLVDSDLEEKERLSALLNIRDYLNKCISLQRKCIQEKDKERNSYKK